MERSRRLGSYGVLFWRSARTNRHFYFISFPWFPDSWTVLFNRESQILAICKECESDIKEYAEKIRSHLSSEENQAALDEVLLRNKATVEGGNLEEGKKIIREFIENNLELSSMWVQIDASMRTLSALNRRKLKRMNAYLSSTLHVKNLVQLHVLQQGLTGGNEPSFFDLAQNSTQA